MSHDSKDIAIPENLKHRLEHELAMDLSTTSGKSSSGKQGPARGSHQDFLSSTRQEALGNESVVVDHALIERIRERSKELDAKLPYMELRLKDVRYTITNHFEDDPNKKKKDDYESAKQEEQEGPRRAKQHIETVASAGPIFRAWKKIKRLITKGKCTDYTQDTIIVDNINLVFEPGKMVLLLGGPGSGMYVCLTTNCWMFRWTSI